MCDYQIGDIVVTDWWSIPEFKKYNGLPATVIKKREKHADVLYNDGVELDWVPNYELRKLNDREVDIGEIKSLF